MTEVTESLLKHKE